MPELPCNIGKDGKLQQFPFYFKEMFYIPLCIMIYYINGVEMLF